METNLVCFFLALLGGGVVAGVKYLLTRRLEQKPPNGFLLASLIRQGMNLAGLAAAGLIGWGLALPLLPLLLGAALGLTVPTVLLAVRAKRRNVGG